MKSFALALLLAILAGCAVVPYGPPVYVGARIDSRPYYTYPYDARHYHARPYGGRRWHDDDD